MSVLLVDDIEEIRFMLRTRLSQRHPTVYFSEAKSGYEASAQLRQTHFDLVISDAQMDEGTGLWLYRFMVKHFPAVPLIIFTGAPESFPASIDQTLKAVIAKENVIELFEQVDKRRAQGTWVKSSF